MSAPGSKSLASRALAFRVHVSTLKGGLFMRKLLYAIALVGSFLVFTELPAGAATNQTVTNAAYYPHRYHHRYYTRYHPHRYYYHGRWYYRYR
jgi:hypothetical protein